MFRTFYDEKRKQWNGLKSRPLFNPQTTLGEILLKSMQMHGPKIAQVPIVLHNFHAFFPFSKKNF